MKRLTWKHQQVQCRFSKPGSMSKFQTVSLIGEFHKWASENEQTMKELMDHLRHEAVNGHLLKHKDYQNRISRTWSNRKAKLLKDSLQAQLQQTQAQVAAQLGAVQGAAVASSMAVAWGSLYALIWSLASH